MPSPLSQLSAGALDWIGSNLDHFDPYAASAASATHGRAKAALELALLCDCAARLPGGDAKELGEAASLVRTLWQDPGFPRLFEGRSGAAASYGLVYAALAPDGIDATVCRGALARLAPGVLAPGGKPPLKRLEIRYYADRAGLAHRIEPYAELIPVSPLVALRPAEQDGPPLTDSDAYSLTHAAFYLGDFGRRRPALPDGAAGRARDLVGRMLGHCVEHDRWDLAAELVLAQFILGCDPLRTAPGAAAVGLLARVQGPDGALPGRSAAQQATASDSAAEIFRKTYHTTLVTALMALIVSSARVS